MEITCIEMIAYVELHYVLGFGILLLSDDTMEQSRILFCCHACLEAGLSVSCCLLMLCYSEDRFSTICTEQVVFVWTPC